MRQLRYVESRVARDRTVPVEANGTAGSIAGNTSSASFGSHTLPETKKNRHHLRCPGNGTEWLVEEFVSVKLRTPRSPAMTLIRYSCGTITS